MNQVAAISARRQSVPVSIFISFVNVRELLSITSLWFLVVTLALSTIYVKQKHRQLFDDLQSLRHDTMHLQIQWQQHVLKRSTSVSVSKVESIAHQSGMHYPTAAEVQWIEY